MFKLQKRADMGTECIEYRKAGEAISLGEVLKYDAGVLKVCAGTTSPEYVSLGTASASGDIVPVKRIYENEIYEAPLQAAGTSLNVGDKVTLHTDGLQLTATTTGGIFEIVEMDGTAVGSKVRGLFRR